MERVNAGMPTGGDLGELLLAAKFAVPDPRPGAVSRVELIERARASGCRVVGVTAPAGYGKTTLLGEWARLDDRRVGWVTLDRFDDDPASLLALLGAAFDRVDPTRADLRAGKGGVGVSLLGRAAPRLASAFASSPEPFVLFLDDLHELQSPGCHDVLEIVASRLPRGSQLVVASRGEQPHLPRLRAAGDAIELGPHDLALDAAGARQVFAALDVDLSAELATQVTARTEGWPVGLHLAALIARERRTSALMPRGEDRYVTDYLYQESFRQHPPDVQAFLRRTAVLQQMSGSLCNAVLGSSDADAQLRRLESANVFLVPLDQRREWYRYHDLFREFLLGELRRTEPELIEQLHADAADWYESQGSPDHAVDHLLETSQRARAARLTAELTLSTYNAGRMSTVQRWLDSLGDSAIREYPPLALLAGHIGVLTGDTTAAERWLAFAESSTFDDAPRDGSGSFESGRAMLRAVICAAGPEAMLEDASVAVANERPGSPWRDTALLEMAEALFLLGRVDEARRRFIESSTNAAAWDNSDTVVYCESQLAMLAMDDGEWTDGAGHVKAALNTLEANGLDDYGLCLAAFAAAGRLALHEGNVGEARRRATQAMRARAGVTYVTPSVAVGLRLHLARLYLAMSDSTTARHLLREIDDILIHRPALGRLVDEVEELRTRAANATTAIASASPLTPAEIRVLPYLQTHLTFQQIGQRLFVSRSTVATQVQSIYQKLGASSRDDAVQRATALGLLGE